MMRRLALAALFSAAFIIPSSAQQQTWVAVASDGAGLWGIAVGMATRQAAETSALGECGMYCKLKFTAQARCVAYAFSETGRAEGFSAGASLQQVEQPAWAAVQCQRAGRFLQAEDRALLRVGIFAGSAPLRGALHHRTAGVPRAHDHERAGRPRSE